MWQNYAKSQITNMTILLLHLSHSYVLKGVFFCLKSLLTFAGNIKTINQLPRTTSQQYSGLLIQGRH